MSEITGLLKKYFGYNSFRSNQEAVIQNILDGNDTFVLMPTGGGKSICYQIPALAMEGTAVVVSPLLSLIKDQVDTLRENGIVACTLNSTQNESENRSARELCLNGTAKLLYISPERLLGELENGIFKHMRVSLFAIDEAHCISQWGHDFRPEYTKLSQIKSYFRKTPIVALTATADKITRDDIIRQLSLQNPRTFVSSFDRPNLSLKVVKGLGKKQKINSILDFIERHPRQSGIIYCLSRQNTETLAKELAEEGVSTGVYHAGLSNSEREQNQNDFLNDKVRVICATVAFGMGIDKSNVRWVIHYNMPKSIESYYQEIGRAGRDGSKADTLLFYTLGDLVMLSNFAKESAQQSTNLDKLNRMQQYAESDICRRRILLSYFGEEMDHDCGNCDVCLNPPERIDGTILVQKALSAVARTEQRVGVNLLIDILRGSRRIEIISAGYHQIKTFGVGADLSFREWQAYLLQMLQLGYIEMAYNDGNTLKITNMGRRVLMGEIPAQLAKVKLEQTTAPVSGKRSRITEAESHLSEDEQLFEQLRKLRYKYATLEDIPAYAIFTDKSLTQMVEDKPVSMTEFSNIAGVSEVKLEKYGQEFITTIRKAIGKKRAKGDTYKETLECVHKGLGALQIAEFRKIQPVTVYSHLAYLVEKGDLTDWSRYISNDEIQAVARVAKKSGQTSELKPIHEALDGNIGFGLIRLALSILKNK